MHIEHWEYSMWALNAFKSIVLFMYKHKQIKAWNEIQWNSHTFIDCSNFTYPVSFFSSFCIIGQNLVISQVAMPFKGRAGQNTSSRKLWASLNWTRLEKDYSQSPCDNSRQIIKNEGKNLSVSVMIHSAYVLIENVCLSKSKWER